jgi:GNAT superfamily N-acetyltransferase
MENDFLSQLEDAALNAWPAPRQMVYDGWLLRFADGYTKRANSINIRFNSSLPLDEKIGYCEKIYKDQGLPVIFRLPDPFVSQELMGALDQAGYRVFDPTFVLGQKIETWEEMPEEVCMREMSIGAWIKLRAVLTGTNVNHWAIHKEILTVIVPEKMLVGMYLKDQPVACGMGVVEGDLLGYFSIFVGEKYRRNGFGQIVMRGLTNWGMARGASFGYLQVEGDNQPALALYEKMGFEVCYRYVYSKRLD